MATSARRGPIADASVIVGTSSPHRRDAFEATRFLIDEQVEKSSFEIEHEVPSHSRIERFIAMLSVAENEDFCRKPRLIERVFDQHPADIADVLERLDVGKIIAEGIDDYWRTTDEGRAALGENDR